MSPRLHPLVAAKGTIAHAKRILLVVIASDRGLCGGFNNQITKAAVRFIRQCAPGTTVSLVLVGRRAERIVRQFQGTIVASLTASGPLPDFEATLPLAQCVFDQFTSHQVDAVYFAYMDYKSALSQVPTILPILPIEMSDATEEIEEESDPSEEEEEGILHYYRKPKQEEDKIELGGMLEPDANQVVRELLARVVKIRMYQALLESTASEHSARMLAMRSSGDAANDMLKELTLALNQARQSAITQEISEISAGKAALE